MPIGYALKSGRFTSQRFIARYWLERADENNEPFVKFSCLYSALNSVAWACSGKSKDGEIFEDLKSQVRNLAEPANVRIEFLQLANQTIAQLKNEFPDGISNLGKIKPIEKKFTAETWAEIAFSELDVQRMNDGDKIYLSIGLIYQFRCNLVHGTKDPADVGNQNIINTINETIECLVRWLLAELA